MGRIRNQNGFRLLGIDIGKYKAIEQYFPSKFQRNLVSNLESHNKPNQHSKQSITDIFSGAKSLNIYSRKASGKHGMQERADPIYEMNIGNPQMMVKGCQLSTRCGQQPVYFGQVGNLPYQLLQRIKLIEYLLHLDIL